MLTVILILTKMILIKISDIIMTSLSLHPSQEQSNSRFLK